MFLFLEKWTYTVFLAMCSSVFRPHAQKWTWNWRQGTRKDFTLRWHYKSTYTLLAKATTMKAYVEAQKLPRTLAMIKTKLEELELKGLQNKSIESA